MDPYYKVYLYISYIGLDTDDEYLEEATDVFVLLLTCLNSRFKVIIISFC